LILGVDGTPIQGVRSGSGWYLTHLLESLSGILEEDKIFVWMNNGFGPEQMRVPQNRFVSLVSTHYPVAALKLSWSTLGSPTLEGLVGRSLDACLYVSPLQAPQKRGGKVLFIHDLVEWVSTDNSQGHPTALSPKDFEKVLSEADLVLTGSEFNRVEIKKRLQGFPDEKIRLVTDGLTPLFQKPALRDKVLEVRNYYGLRKPYILYAGTLETRKNLLRLVHGFLLYQQQTRTETELILAGPKGWIGDDFMQFLLSSALAGKVRWLDVVSSDHLAALYSDAVLFAYPALQEGSGVPILEAMGCGAPVLCADSGALPEVVGDAALKVPPTQVGQWAAALEKVAGDVELQEEMRRRGFARAASFRWDKSAKEVLSALVAVAKARA
jgi:alpha-1,3-rhamnosyl/mannosyltransferase